MARSEITNNNSIQGDIVSPFLRFEDLIPESMRQKVVALRSSPDTLSNVNEIAIMLILLGEKLHKISNSDAHWKDLKTVVNRARRDEQSVIPIADVEAALQSEWAVEYHRKESASIIAQLNALRLGEVQITKLQQEMMDAKSVNLLVDDLMDIVLDELGSDEYAEVRRRIAVRFEAKSVQESS